MILADKILCLRKQRGWSQEGLARELGVSRQSVSKWESAQAMPDLERIVELSELFGVSTDVLIKDDEPLPEPVATHTAPAAMPPQGEPQAAPAARPMLPTRRVSLDEAREFIDLNRRAAQGISLGVVMCILSPLPLLGLVARSVRSPDYGANDILIPAVGVPVLLVIVAIATAIMIMVSLPLKKYSFLEEELVELDPQAEELVRQEQAAFNPTFMRDLVVGVSLCILAAVPVVVLSVLAQEDSHSALPIIGVCITLGLVALGVYFLVHRSTIHGAYTKLVNEGDYTAEAKTDNARFGMLRLAYWLAVVIIYLWYSLAYEAWARSWIIWPIAAVGFILLQAILRAFSRNTDV